MSGHTWNPLSILKPRVDKSQLEESIAKAVKARRLLESEEFQWWRGLLEAWVESQKEKLDYTLVHGAGEGLQYVRRKGMIQGVNKVYKELDMLSGSLEDLESKLKELDDDEPVVWRPKAV